jgi:regulator of sigma E protease
VGGFKAIFDIFPSTWSWERSEHHSFIINYAWSNEPITYSSTGGHVMFLICMKLSAVKTVISSLRMHKWLVSYYLSLLLFANRHCLQAIVGVKKTKM